MCLKSSTIPASDLEVQQPITIFCGMEWKETAAGKCHRNQPHLTFVHCECHFKSQYFFLFRENVAM